MITSNIYYISDHHFYHELALKRSRTCFSNIEEMNKEIIYRHNNTVNDNDIVFLLGDIIVTDKQYLSERMEETVSKLNGHLHLILGNHDYKYCSDFSYQNTLNFESNSGFSYNNFSHTKTHKFLKYFESIHQSLLLKDSNKWVQLMHYPILNWYRKNKGAYHIYGHLHDESESIESKILANEKHAFNVCVENINYTPITLSDLIK